MSTKIAISGYGNLGKGVEKMIRNHDDLELVGVFTRRNPEEVVTDGTPVFSVEELENHKDDIDVLILCGGSATDLPVQSPEMVKSFNIVDSFDTHANIPKHLANVDKNAKENGNVAILSIGWDPGLFSLNRLLADSILPKGKTYTFWGKGVSQGHSDAIRRIEGVKDAKQYTIPIEEAVEKARSGENPELSTRDKHLRECFVVLEEGTNPELVEKQIKEMPNYFDEYDTVVHFISQEELDKNHSELPHGGFVIHSANEGNHKFVSEYKLDLDSNPEFTSAVLVAYARAADRLAKEGVTGAKTIFDIPIKYLSPYSDEEIAAHWL